VIAALDRELLPHIANTSTERQVSSNAYLRPYYGT
jgi:hypothetical protein